MISAPGVYLIRNSRTGGTYVGASGNVQRRWDGHRAALDAGRHSNRALQRAWRDDGSSAFTVSLVEVVIPETSRLRSAEQRWLERMRTLGTLLYSEVAVPQQPQSRLHPLPELRRQRLLAALTQEELASRAGIRRLTVTRLENGGDTRPTTIRKLADALGCEPTDLLEPPQ